MNEPAPGEPWAFIAHKNGYWAGLCAADGTKEAAKFVSDFVAGGFSITTVYSREEFNAILKPMEMWSKSPERKGKSR
jgi:hypothetical protein